MRLTILATIVLSLSACTRLGAAAAAFSGAPPPSKPKVQVVCYAADGKQLFPALIVVDVDLPEKPSDAFRVTFAGGLHAWVRAPACVVAEMSAQDLAAVQDQAAQSRHVDLPKVKDEPKEKPKK